MIRTLLNSAWLATLIITSLQAQAQPEVIKIEGGTFDMGSKEKNDPSAKPIHSVTVSSFSMAKYPTTVAEYRAFCTATDSPMPNAPPWGWNDKAPMVNVSHIDAIAYCKWLSKKYNHNYRLPTEAEYEFAAHGGNSSKGFIYSGGNNLDSVAWYSDNSGNQTHPVGLKAPNELGLYDLSGNVYEWCSDWFGSYGLGAVTDPQGPLMGTHYVLRGGSWLHVAIRCRITRRAGDFPNYRAYTCGFRVVFSE